MVRGGEIGSKLLGGGAYAIFIIPPNSSRAAHPRLRLHGARGNYPSRILFQPKLWYLDGYPGRIADIPGTTAVSYWMGTAMTALAWLFCVWYAVGLMRRKKE